MPDIVDEEAELDRICIANTAFPSFALLLKANRERGYIPTIRLAGIPPA